MKLTISQDIVAKYPDLRLGVIIAGGIDNSGDDKEIAGMLKNAQEFLAESMNIDSVSEHPAIAKWREVYASFGSKPRDYRSSIESLARSVLNGRSVRHISKLVDLYNYISLKYVIPVGGEDLDKTGGNLYLKFAEGGENFIPLGSDKPETAYPGEMIYCDDTNSVLCRRWNWRESDRTKLTESTKRCIIVIEGFDETVENASKELETLVKKFCNAETRLFVMDRNKNRIEW